MSRKLMAGAALVASTGTMIAALGMSQASAATAPPAGAKPAAAPAPNPVLQGKRQVAIVRAEAFEGALSLLDNGRLGEVDGDEGHTLFVLAPLGGDKYLIRTATPDTATGGEPSCWKVHNPHTTASLTVRKAACDTRSSAQRFTVKAVKKAGTTTYAISNGSAYLQYFANSGLILEELGDAPLVSTFKIVDNGPAPVLD
ncbi:hypothetical protein [Actinoplanes sp. TFC3]|uniref:hypothetical protein n=1 Tax=Actinoplanes sp. TFC3 TaxID=1710355 RepID=UPI00082F6BFA|nr:hypothetical protein [Actinoplanes sp. TFC3]